MDDAKDVTTLQPNRICGTCKHRVETRLPPPNIGSVGVCTLMPPTPCVAFAQGPGGQVGIVAQVTARPQVKPDDRCGLWERHLQ